MCKYIYFERAHQEKAKVGGHYFTPISHDAFINFVKALYNVTITEDVFRSRANSRLPALPSLYSSLAATPHVKRSVS